jgi:hypothetical protein
MSDESDAIEPPTCSTCPHWRPVDEDDMPIPLGHPDRDGDEVEGECHRNAPIGRMEMHGGTLFIAAGRHSYAWPRTACFDGCGEHPSMGEYIRRVMRGARP